MTQEIQTDFVIFRRKQVQAVSGYSRSTLYSRMAEGLWPKPVHLGPRAVGWPAREVKALNEARIAGLSDPAIRELVQQLAIARQAGAAA